MASLTWWMRVWVNSGSWWWTRRPGVLRSMGSQRVRHNWVTELNRTECQPPSLFHKRNNFDIKKQKRYSLIKDDPLNWINQCYVKFTTFLLFFSFHQESVKIWLAVKRHIYWYLVYSLKWYFFFKPKNLNIKQYWLKCMWVSNESLNHQTHAKLNEKQLLNYVPKASSWQWSFSVLIRKSDKYFYTFGIQRHF